MSLFNRIERRPDVMLGKPMIKGTRIPVELIVRKWGEGASIEDLLDGYPNLNIYWFNHPAVWDPERYG